MRIGILGSGSMGAKLGTIFARAGHQVVFSYSRSESKLKSLARKARADARAGTPREAVECDAVLLAVNWSQVDDVLQQVHLELWQAVERGEEIAALWGWLYTVARRRSFDLNEVQKVPAVPPVDVVDKVVGITTSGRSPNVVEALRLAREKGLLTVGLTGGGGGRLGGLVHYLIDVPHEQTPRIQEVHTMVVHVLCQVIEEAVPA